MPAQWSHKEISEALARYPLIHRVFDLSTEQGMQVYLVGGTVRDLVLGRETHDLDFAAEGSGLTLARHVADRLRGYFVALDRERHTGRVLLPGAFPSPQSLDIASLRGNTLKTDLEGRDFTLNAIAIARTSQGAWQLVDPLCGVQDLRQRVLRACSPSSLSDDPVRALRAVRMQVQFKCTIDEPTETQIRAAAALLRESSAERIRDEWFKILGLDDSVAALEKMVRLGLLEEVVPEISGLEERAHALRTVQAIQYLWAALGRRPGEAQPSIELGLAKRLHDLWPQLHARFKAPICDERSYLAMLKCAGLLHSAAGSSAELAKRWRLSRREAELLGATMRNLSRAAALTNRAELDRRAIYRFFAEVGEPGIEAVLLHLAHALATHEAVPHTKEWKEQTECAARLLCAWFHHRDTQIAPTPLLTGRDLMCLLDLPPGPQIGDLLRSLLEEQAAGEILTRQQAIDYVKQKCAGEKE
jgi:tRNA nucleotidyltransferase/poly(A) polymerase